MCGHDHNLPTAEKAVNVLNLLLHLAVFSKISHDCQEILGSCRQRCESFQRLGVSKVMTVVGRPSTELKLVIGVRG